MTGAEITFVTGNQNKLREVAQILASDSHSESAIKIISKKIDLPELQGEVEDIAKQKCALAVKEVGGPTVSGYSYFSPHSVHAVHVKAGRLELF